MNQSEPFDIAKQFALLSESLLKRDQHMEGRFDELDRRFEKIDERFEKIDERFAKLEDQFMLLYQHAEKRFDELEAKVDTKADADRVYTALDGIIARLDTDDEERAAIISEQRRHSKWIGQLAEHTHTKLVPKQEPA